MNNGLMPRNNNKKTFYVLKQDHDSIKDKDVLEHKCDRFFKEGKQEVKKIN